MLAVIGLLTYIRNEDRRDIVMSVAFYGQFGAIIAKLCFTKTICQVLCKLCSGKFSGCGFLARVDAACIGLGCLKLVALAMDLFSKNKWRETTTE
jgi:hypothetical protein